MIIAAVVLSVNIMLRNAYYYYVVCIINSIQYARQGGSTLAFIVMGSFGKLLILVITTVFLRVLVMS